MMNADKRIISWMPFMNTVYMKMIRTEQAEVHSAYFIQRDQLGIIVTHLTNTKFDFNVTFSLQPQCSFLNSLLIIPYFEKQKKQKQKRNTLTTT